MNMIFLLLLAAGIASFIVGFQITKLPQPDSSIIKAGEWLEKAEAAYGEESQKIIPFLYDLGKKIIQHQKNHEVAFSYVERAFVIRNRQGDPESLEMAEALQRTGECLLFMNNIPLAEERISKALAIRRAKLGDDHPMTGQCWAVMTMLELLKVQPGIQPVMLRSILSVNPMSPAAMPPAAKENAEKTLVCIDKARKEVWGTVSQPETTFGYDAAWNSFATCDPLYDDIMSAITALKEGPVYKGGTSPQKCFVATAVYGSPDCPQVVSFRRFRDRKLVSTSFGRAFIAFYGAAGPIAAALVGNRPVPRKLCRMILDPLAKRLGGE